MRKFLVLGIGQDDNGPYQMRPLFVEESGVGEAIQRIRNSGEDSDWSLWEVSASLENPVFTQCSVLFEPGGTAVRSIS